MKPRDAFIIETFMLSRSNHEQWSKFMTALETFTQEQVNEQTNAPYDSTTILIANGKARYAMQFFDVLKNIDDLYQKIRK